MGLFLFDRFDGCNSGQGRRCFEHNKASQH
jgi:hypothetical protein